MTENSSNSFSKHVNNIGNSFTNIIDNKVSDQLMLKQALALVLEKIMNKALTLNINNNTDLSALNNKCLTIILAELNFPLSFIIYQQKILVNSLTDNSDCTITTSLKTLKDLQKNQQLTELIKQDKLDINGDIKLAQQFANIAQNLTIDWQSELAKHIGDIATYKLGRVAKTLVDKVIFFKNQVQADSSEYIVHEQKLMITQNQMDNFCQQVEQINSQTDTLMLRLNALTKK